ncbi:hypothetical protein MRB53_036971 [Persea americana]|nr:hypothetical protein MRB53_036971 [Persea americana]
MRAETGRSNSSCRRLHAHHAARHESRRWTGRAGCVGSDASDLQHGRRVDGTAVTFAEAASARGFGLLADRED